MYYEEKMINGRMHYRIDPNGEWVAYTTDEMHKRYSDMKARMRSMHDIGKMKDVLIEDQQKFIEMHCNRNVLSELGNSMAEDLVNTGKSVKSMFNKLIGKSND